MTEHLPSHQERSHAILSASGSDRWINCPGSIALTADLPDTTSEFAEWGTVCHELGELALRARFLGEKVNFQQTVQVFDADTCTTKEVPKFDEGHFAAAAQYRDYVRDLITRYGEGETPIIVVERRVKFRRWVPQGFGTGDCIIVFPQKRLAIMVDLKGGEGVLVFAEDNSQLKLYAAGTLDLLDKIVEIDRIVLSICQPRRDHFDEWEISTADLLAWLEQIRPVAEEAFAGSARLVPGEHCQFCKAVARCPERAKQAMALYEDPNRPVLLSPEQIADMLPKLALVEAWAKKLQTYAYAQALNGVKFPGYKLVAGRANRKWTDPTKVGEILKEDGISEDEIWSKSLIGITEAEKLVGKKHRVFELAKKGEGKPTLVPETDPRAELCNAAAVIANFDD